MGSFVRILLHAANGVGLGHVSRMSVFANSLRNRLGAGLALSYFSTCSNAREFLGDGGRVLWAKSPAEPEALAGFQECIELTKPNIVVCDTWWPRQQVRRARHAGARTVLVTRLIGPNLAARVYDEALEDFDAIVLCAPLEEAWHFYPPGHAGRNVLALPQVRLGGRIGRIAMGTRFGPQADEPAALFSLGGGGDYPKPGDRNKVSSLVRQCQVATDDLAQTGVKCLITQGPLMGPVPQVHWTILNTMHAHHHMTPRTVVVSRPGNLTPAEALAAGSRLLLVGVPEHDDEARLRATFLESAGLALVHRPTDSLTLAQTIAAQLQQGWNPAAIRTRAGVNTGLPIAIEHLLGEFA